MNTEYEPLFLLNDVSGRFLSQDGATTLIKAAHFGRSSIVALLIDKGANIDALDNVSLSSEVELL